MQATRKGFEHRWSIWLSGLSTVILMIGAGLALWIQVDPNALNDLQATNKDSLLRNYNNIAHGVWVGVLIILAGILIRSIKNAPAQEPEIDTRKNWISTIGSFIRHHPAVTIVLTAYAVVMVQESSWFYKEILTWYDDIYSDHLLNNFSLRQSLINETMGRNDFRFYPLSHQDLHILSWFSPYTKVWALVSAIELIITIILGCKLVDIENKHRSSRSIFLMGTLLLLFTSAAAFNYFQFIYSERFLTFLLALYAYHYCRYQHSRQQRSGRLALLFALFIPFFKDTAILLTVVPPASTIILGSIGKMQVYPAWGSLTPAKWIEAYAIEIALCSLAPFFLASFVMLSALPSLAAGVQRYDSHLGFSVLALDIRLILLIVFIATRLWLIQRDRTSFTTLDSLNLAALAYGIALFALIGLEGSNYMTLPIQFVAVLDILMIWEKLVVPRLGPRVTSRQGQAFALGATLLLLNVEDRQAETFRQRAELISWKQRSWRRTFNMASKIARKAKERGEPVNLIYSKGWFQHSDQMRSLTFDRLIYYDIDTGQYKVKSGIDKDKTYKPIKGDYLIDIDSGYKLSKFGIDLANYELLYQEDLDRDYARIFRHL